MPKIIQDRYVVERFLQLAYPNQWVVAAYEPVEDEDKQAQYWEVFRSLRDNWQAGEFNLQTLIDVGCQLVLCDSEQEAYQIFKLFPDPEVIGYAVLFGPHVTNPAGIILTTNT